MRSALAGVAMSVAAVTNAAAAAPMSVIVRMALPPFFQSKKMFESALSSDVSTAVVLWCSKNIICKKRNGFESPFSSRFRLIAGTFFSDVKNIQFL
jgi:hypothetical protein